MPTTDGEPVPVLIAQGSDDEVIHCQPADGGAVLRAAASNCMSVALFDSLRDDAYCPAAATPATWSFALYRKDGAPARRPPVDPRADRRHR